MPLLQNGNPLPRLGIPAVGAFAEKLRFPFALGHSASAHQGSERVGAFVDESPRYLQPTAFILTPKSEVLASVYASHAVGLVSFLNSK